nr:hypothetical protein [Leifsonia poae]
MVEAQLLDSGQLNRYVFIETLPQGSVEPDRPMKRPPPQPLPSTGAIRVLFTEDAQSEWLRECGVAGHDLAGPDIPSSKFARVIEVEDWQVVGDLICREGTPRTRKEGRGKYVRAPGSPIAERFPCSPGGRV